MIYDMDSTVAWNLPYPGNLTHLSIGELKGGAPGFANWLDLGSAKTLVGDGRQLYMEFQLSTLFTGTVGTSTIMPQLLLGVAYSDSTNLLSLQNNFLVPLWTGGAILTNPAEYTVIRGMSIAGGGNSVTQLSTPAALGRRIFVPIMSPSTLLWNRHFDSGASHNNGVRRRYLAPVAASVFGSADGASAFTGGAFQCRIVDTISQAENLTTGGAEIWHKNYPTGMAVT
jgi:hypothetical protein